jgi:hypothetical protein
VIELSEQNQLPGCLCAPLCGTDASDLKRVSVNPVFALAALRLLHRSHWYAITLAVVSLCAALDVGCATSINRAKRWVGGDWAADYQTAERRALESNSGVLILYTNIDLTRKDAMREAVKGAASGDASKYVRCVLFRDNEPDRRYVAQYGVDRAPALIVMHPDGTYHARSGSMPTEQIADFLASATPPGSVPKLNPFIPRESNYAWNPDFESAERVSRESGRPMLVVLDRWMTRDWRKLRAMLERREVYTRFTDMVHCRPGSVWSSSGSAAARFGVKNLPALVIVEPDGNAQTLELPASYEAIVRFADGALGESSADRLPPYQGGTQGGSHDPNASTASGSTAASAPNPK